MAGCSAAKKVYLLVVPRANLSVASSERKTVAQRAGPLAGRSVGLMVGSTATMSVAPTAWHLAVLTAVYWVVWRAAQTELTWVGYWAVPSESWWVALMAAS